MFKIIKLSDDEKQHLLLSFFHNPDAAKYQWGLNLLEETAYISAPTHFNTLHVNDFLRDIEFIFSKQEHKSLILDLFQTRTISIIGMILIYKFIAYTTKNHSTEFPIYNIRPELDAVFVRIGLSGLINAYLKNANTKIAYGNLKSIEEQTFFIYPQNLDRNEEASIANVKAIFIDTISEFYRKHSNSDAIEVISICVGELIMNFWAHATDESDTIATAKGTKSSFKIVIADNGQGIISTLSPIFNTTAKNILSSSIKKGISSKKHLHHMGFGLFYVSELTKINNGQLNIWSEGYHLHVDKQRTKVCKSGYWKGTIIELDLNLSKPKSLPDIKLYKSFSPLIKINFGA